MNKSIFSVFFSGLLLMPSAYSSSAISLPVPVQNNIVADSKMNIPLDTLQSEVPYLVTCVLQSDAPSTLDMHFSPQLARNGGFGVDKLNGQPILKNVGTLKTGENELSFLVSITKKNMTASAESANSMILKNLDHRYSVAVKKCEAKPASKVTTAAKRMLGGYFYVTNYLPYYVDISVGNFFPTDYCIYPYSKRYIEVSTGYQDIDIVATHY